MKKLMIFLLFLSLLSIPLHGHAAAPAESYVRAFQEEFGTNSVITNSAKSPFRSSSDVSTSDYRVMTSKNNQPRNEGISNPHQGTDMRGAENKNKLKTATGAKAGDTVYIVGVRNYSGPYKTSIFPQYYKAPYPALSTSNANTIAVAYTIV